MFCPTSLGAGAMVVPLFSRLRRVPEIEKYEAADNGLEIEIQSSRDRPRPAFRLHGTECD